MAHIIVKNSLSNLKAARVNISFPVFVSTESEGDPIWVLETATTYPSASGTDIRPSYTNSTEGVDNLDSAVANGISEIASQIDWGILEQDERPPYLVEARPQGEDVSIASNIYIDVKEDAPTAGIDLSEIQIVLNNGDVDFDITDECELYGDPFEYVVHWRPTLRIMDTYRKD